MTFTTRNGDWLAAVAILVAVAVAPWASSAPATAPSKRVPPDASQQASAERLVRDLYRSEYAQPAAEARRQLAQRLLKQARESEDDPTGRFVLYREAQTVAASAGDLAIARTAISEMSDAFAVDPLPLRLTAAQAAGPNVTTARALEELATDCLAALDDAVRVDAYPLAGKFAAVAEDAAKRAQNSTLKTQVQAAGRKAQAVAARHAAIGPALTVLQRNPDDRAANLQVGTFLCVSKGDWERGLPLLSKGAEGALGAVVARDVQRPTEPATRYELADAWWGLAESARSPDEGSAFKSRAANWYRAALPGLVGLRKGIAEKRSQAPAPIAGPNVPKVNTVGMTLALISPPVEPAERQRRGVLRPYLLGAHEVTVAQFAAFVKETGYKTDAEMAGSACLAVDADAWPWTGGASWRDPKFEQKDDHPVTCVTGNDAAKFCQWLGRKEGRRYRLPTEAEWDYAARAGSAATSPPGDELAALREVGWFSYDGRRASAKGTRPVGELLPNAWGLFDMVGNVWEWCGDSLDKGKQRVVRGGGWYCRPDECQLRARLLVVPDARYNSYGFRIVQEP